ncbi:hypothetical protein O8E88_002379 [Flavobacterium psychrophilum]|uniref:hypothetical protein n=1 Tax=Flavobacterium psychrophilum TaxID=96345 RepID=UPI00090B69A1|nr:hypothetical protein [Flavobacterium psychrophilum]EKT2070545.1 hypothetical protein [Flavobacterium psychrophilum]EKT2072921.1 hypothetical protein [Flavobacterium psychrophilum]EKT4492335.1 hypothetical protein [Flavobacterium psychrophilum]SHH93745.1 Hypothetical protein THC0290_1194 [Flavobacterium psychrophilum]
MKTESELNECIVKITMTILNEFPELMKFLNEMPVTIPTEQSPEINTKILQEYYDSLEILLYKYAPNHSSFINNF